MIRAYNRILDLKEKHVDTEVLKILVQAICSHSKDAYDRPASAYCKEALKLFGRLTSQVTNNHILWELYADLSSQDGSVDHHKRSQLLQKSVACLSQTAGWEKNLENVKQILRSSDKFVQGK